MNTLGEWFRNAFPLDEKPKGSAVLDTNYDPYGNAIGRERPGRQLPIREARKQPIFAPTRDEFAAWRDDSVTQFVMRALERNAEECRESWLEQSWEGGRADQRILDAMRERHDALMGFTSHYEVFCAVLGLEPQEAEHAA